MLTLKTKGRISLIILSAFIFLMTAGCGNDSIVGPSTDSEIGAHEITANPGTHPKKDKPIKRVDPIVGPEVEPQII